MDELAAAINSFEAATPNIAIWKRWPAVTEAEDALTDSWACESVSVEFASHLTANGIPARLVRAVECLDFSMHDSHTWVRGHLPEGDIDIDWTARQFHDLEWPPLPEHQNLPCPLVFAASDTHPVSGRYSAVTVEALS